METNNTINGRTPEEIRKGQSFSEYLDEKLSKVNISSLEDEDQEQEKRTPEETKKGLSLCYADVCDCSECPYFNMEDCDKKLASDVLMLFQRLERERDEARNDLDTLNYANTELYGAYDAMKRERDAAVEDIFRMCTNCKHEKLGYGVGPCPPIEEYLTNDCSNWQWRGIQEGWSDA